MAEAQCPHGRAWESCVRCDPSCPSGLPEATYTRWQEIADRLDAATTERLRREWEQQGIGWQRQGKD